MYDLFEHDDNNQNCTEEIASGAFVLRGFTQNLDTALLKAVNHILQQSPPQKMRVASGGSMSTDISNCGRYGWISDANGYRYSPHEPSSNRPWPQMPSVFKTLAANAAQQAGYANFIPDSCLINCYEPMSKMGLHQDKNEKDHHAPIVSVSLGLPAVFLFGGLSRSDKPQRIRLSHGDVVVWGGVSRYVFHGIESIDDGFHPIVGKRRLNLTFRKVV